MNSVASTQDNRILAPVRISMCVRIAANLFVPEALLYYEKKSNISNPSVNASRLISQLSHED